MWRRRFRGVERRRFTRGGGGVRVCSTGGIVFVPTDVRHPRYECLFKTSRVFVPKLVLRGQNTMRPGREIVI
jgi:hypothetical protein